MRKRVNTHDHAVLRSFAVTVVAVLPSASVVSSTTTSETARRRSPFTTTPPSHYGIKHPHRRTWQACEETKSRTQAPSGTPCCARNVCMRNTPLRENHSKGGMPDHLHFGALHKLDLDGCARGGIHPARRLRHAQPPVSRHLPLGQRDPDRRAR